MCTKISPSSVTKDIWAHPSTRYGVMNTKIQSSERDWTHQQPRLLPQPSGKTRGCSWGASDVCWQHQAGLGTCCRGHRSTGGSPGKACSGVAALPSTPASTALLVTHLFLSPSDSAEPEVEHKPNTENIREGLFHLVLKQTMLQGYVSKQESCKEPECPILDKLSRREQVGAVYKALHVS